MNGTRLVWDGLTRVSKDRGWLFVTTNSRDWPNTYRDGIGWTEPCAAGNFLDYGPDHYRSPHRYCSESECRCRLTQPGNIHCVVYTEPRDARYVETIADARRWIEEQVRLRRPELRQEKAA